MGAYLLILVINGIPLMHEMPSKAACDKALRDIEYAVPGFSPSTEVNGKCVPVGS